MELKQTLNENVNPYKALYNVYEEMYNPDLAEEGLFDRITNRVKGAISGGKASAGNVVNKVTNTAKNIGGNIANSAKVIGKPMTQQRVATNADMRQTTQATQVDARNAKLLTQIEDIANNFTNDAIKLKLLNPQYKDMVGIVLESLMAVSLNVQLPDTWLL
jgi:hypothetical protein